MFVPLLLPATVHHWPLRLFMRQREHSARAAVARHGGRARQPVLSSRLWLGSRSPARAAGAPPPSPPGCCSTCWPTMITGSSRVGHLGRAICALLAWYGLLITIVVRM